MPNRAVNVTNRLATTGDDNVLNSLTLNAPCAVTMTGGHSVAGVYGGVESIHDDWFILVATDDETHSISVDSIVAAASSAV
jgi:hypothetical protein